MNLAEEMMEEIKDIPLGKRYPKSKRKLSTKDIKDLDLLYAKLNRASRYTDEWDSLTASINRLLGYEAT